MLVRPRITAPAARSRATAGASAFAGGASARIFEPARVTSPATSSRSSSEFGRASPGSALCGRCLADAPHYDATVAALAYRFPADTLVHALKFRSQLALAPLLGDLLQKCIPAGERADCVLPVPLSNERLRERGYNQAAEIARHVARERRARLELTVVVRERNTRAQADLPWSDRARNVRGAFRCERSLDGAAIAVIDDVMTTGATLDELAATLKRAGAARVVNWVVARTFPPDA